MLYLSEICFTKILAEDIWIEIISLLTITDIISLSECSKYFSRLCNSKIIRNNLLNRFPDDTLELDDFTLKELEFYSKVYPSKRRLHLNKIADEYDDGIMNPDIYIDDNIYSLSDDNELVFKQFRDNINRRVLFEYEHIYLYNDGIVSDEDALIYEKVINIDICNGDVIIICRDGKYLTWNNGVLKYIEGINIIQTGSDLLLSSNNEVYMKCENNHDIICPIKIFDPIRREFRNHRDFLKLCKISKLDKIGNDEYYIFPKTSDLGDITLPKIKQIYDNRLLTFDGIIYYTEMCANDQLGIWIQASEQKSIYISSSYDIDINNNVVDKDFKLNNIIDICDHNERIYALDKDFKLHIINEDEDEDKIVHDLLTI